MLRYKALPGLVVLLLASGPALGVPLTLTDKNSTADFDPDSQAGMFNWTVDSVDHMCQQWFWYRVGDNAEASVDTLSKDFEGATDTNGSGFNNNLFLRYVDTVNNFDIELNFNLAGGLLGSETSDISEVITIHNRGTSALDFHFFQYSDFELAGTQIDDRVEINAGMLHAKQFDNVWIMTETTENPNGDHGEVGSDALIPTTLAKLNDGVATTLNDFLGPITQPGDLTWAFQWDRTIGGGDSFQISKDKQIRTFVPEPVTMAGLLIGIGTLAGYVRKRR